MGCKNLSFFTMRVSEPTCSKWLTHTHTQNTLLKKKEKVVYVEHTFLCISSFFLFFFRKGEIWEQSEIVLVCIIDRTRFYIMYDTRFYSMYVYHLSSFSPFFFLFFSQRWKFLSRLVSFSFSFFARVKILSHLVFSRTNTATTTLHALSFQTVS